MKEFLVESNDNVNGGVQRVYKFPNGYGASVIKGPYTYGGKKGLWELAVLKDDELCYSTSITDDVIGHLNDPEMDRILKQISMLDEWDEYCEHCGDKVADCTGYKCWIR